MRKLINPMPSGGAPFNNEDLSDVFQTEVWDTIQALLSAYNADVQGVIISGCVVTANASNFDMTSGIVYLNGEFMRIDAVTNQSYTKYIVPSSVNNVQRVFADSTTKNFIVEKKAELSASTPVSGQFITISSLTNSLVRRIDEMQRSIYRTSSAVESKADFFTKIIEIGDWNMDSNLFKDVSHGVDYKKIRSISVTVRSDDDNDYYDFLNTQNNNNNSYRSGFVVITSTNITLFRVESTNGGLFDGTNFDTGTSFNRGWVTILYER